MQTSKIRIGKYITFFKGIVVIILFLLPFILYFLISFKLWILIIAVAYLANFLVYIDILIKRRVSYESKTSWFILYLLTPFAFFFVYQQAGYVSIRRRLRLSKAAAIEKSLHGQTYDYYEKSFPYDFNFKNNFVYQSKPITFNNKIIFLNKGNVKFPELFADLRKAQTFINIQYFIINDGIIYHQLEKILLERARAGVIINILVDYVGCSQTPDSAYMKLSTEPRINFVQFNRINHFTISGFANYRSHNKFIIIDNRIAYFGGINIGDEYASLYHKFGDWYDLHLKLQGDIVDQMNRQFIFQWYLATKQLLTPPERIKFITTKKIPVQLFTDGPHWKQLTFIDNFTRLVNSTNNSIRIVTPYLVIPKQIINLLERASNRGVDIQIITIGRPDKKSAYNVSKLYADRLIAAKIKIYRLENIFIHSKFYLFDNNLAITGTSNLDNRSLFLHFESDLLIQNKKVYRELETIWNQILEKSTLIKPLSVKTFRLKLIFIFYRLISPFL